MELPFEKAGSGRLRDFLWWPSLQGLDLIQVCLIQSARSEETHNGGASKHLLWLSEAHGIQIPHSEGKGALQFPAKELLRHPGRTGG